MLGPLLANVVLVVLVREGGAAASCGPLVGFLQRDGRWEAVLAVTAPDTFVPGDDFNLQVTMALREERQDWQARLELPESAVEAEAKLRSGDPLLYRVRFPVPDSAPLPRVTAVTANGARLCEVESDFGPRTPSQQVTHSLKSSSSNTTQGPTTNVPDKTTSSPHTTHVPTGLPTTTQGKAPDAQLPVFDSTSLKSALQQPITLNISAFDKENLGKTLAEALASRGFSTSQIGVKVFNIQDLQNNSANLGSNITLEQTLQNLFKSPAPPHEHSHQQTPTSQGSTLNTGSLNSPTPGATNSSSPPVWIPVRIPVITTDKGNNLNELLDADLCGRRIYNESIQCVDILEPITDLTQWPWLAALVSVALNPAGIVYSGTLISKKHVLTAARKFTLDTQGVLFSAEKMVAIFGIRHLHGEKDGVEKYIAQEKKVASIIIHPDFDYSQIEITNDMAIVLLESPVLVNPFVRPACLWSAPSPPFPGTTGFVVGWDYFTAYAKSFDATVASREFCFNQSSFGSAEKLAFCAANNQGFGLCIAGMGAGLYIPDFLANGGLRWILAGSINFIPRLGEGKQQELCDNKKPFFLNDLSKHLPWIQSIINQ